MQQGHHEQGARWRPWDFGIWSFIKSEHKNKQKQNPFYTVPVVLV